MANAIPRKMNYIQISSSILVLFISLSQAIRVDWNTNKGPIVPPIPTQQPRPQPPYRSPAPVWEDQSDDISNPNPYRYILPPTSRPRPPVDNYLRTPLYPNNPQQQQQKPNYGQIVPNSNDIYRDGNSVSSLGVQYIPNIGYKYSAVVPQKSYYLQQNDIYDHKNEKANGRYNAKLKKYKAYEEKMKYFPKNYAQQTNQYQFAVQPQQQLPLLQPSQQFRPTQNFNQQQLPIQQSPIPFKTQLVQNNQQQQNDDLKHQINQQIHQKWDQQNWNNKQQQKEQQQQQQQKQNIENNPTSQSYPTQQTYLVSATQSNNKITTTSPAPLSTQNQQQQQQQQQEQQNLVTNNKQS